MRESQKTAKKRGKEIAVVEKMIRLYCRGNHGTGELCPQCRQLYEYARSRSEHCPFMESKTFCSNCQVHCYQPQMREKIRTVMRYSGPRMILYHPGMAVWHVITGILEKKRQRRKEREKG